MWFFPVFQYFLRVCPFARTRKKPRPGFAFLGFGHLQRFRSGSARGWASGSNRGNWRVPTPGREPGIVSGDFTPGPLKRVKFGRSGIRFVGLKRFRKSIFGGENRLFGGDFGIFSGGFWGRDPGRFSGRTTFAGFFGAEISGCGAARGTFSGNFCGLVSGFGASRTTGLGATTTCRRFRPRTWESGWVIRQS